MRAAALPPHDPLACNSALSPTAAIDWDAPWSSQLEPSLTVRPSATPPVRALRPCLQHLEEAFSQPFSIIDTASGETIYAAKGSLAIDIDARIPLLEAVADRGRPEIVEDEAPLCLLAIPLAGVTEHRSLAAVATFVTLRVDHEAEVASAARVFGVDAGRAFRWATTREVANPRMLLQLAEATHERLAQRRQLELLTTEAEESSAYARDTQVELSLIHRIVRRLHVAESEQELWRETLRSLAEAIPAEGFAFVATQDESHERVILQGSSPVDAADLSELVAELEMCVGRKPLVLNRRETGLATWRFPLIRELACVPVIHGDRVLAWIVAVNHRGSGGDRLDEFGSAELRILESTAAILGIHAGNSRMFRRQTELFASTVRALTSAIDAKDRYTCGHSDRVARLSVRLAQQLGLPVRDIDTLYLGGLLHDIGKIGIDDHVLNKPGQLTDDEFDHIKQHPEFGYQILQGVSQFQKILPIVLHHHEAWNGRGYPHGLAGEETPLMARIVAVADSFDAMTSDRPYRSGMPIEKVESIFRDGAGKQWDPAIIDAFFVVRDEFVKVAEGAEDQCQGVALDPAAWIE